MNEIKVADSYRTNNLSLQPGGYVVAVTYSDGKVLVYDKVKKPGSYIKTIKNDNTNPISEIAVNDSVVWTKGCGREVWEI